MAFCTQCGARLGEEARFCTQCGNPVLSVPVEEAAPAPQLNLEEQIPTTIPEEPVAEPTPAAIPEEPAPEETLVEFPEEPAAEENGWYASTPEETAPPAYEAPAYEEPAYTPPAYEEPAYTPPAYEPPRQEMPPVFYDAPRGGYSQQPMYTAPEKPVSPWMYLLLMIVFAIPVVGFILIIVLACGAAANKNIRNFALAYVLVWVICIVLILILAAVAAPLIMEIVNELQYMF